jgi:hypothetical protein
MHDRLFALFYCFVVSKALFQQNYADKWRLVNEIIDSLHPVISIVSLSQNIHLKTIMQGMKYLIVLL